MNARHAHRLDARHALGRAVLRASLATWLGVGALALARVAHAQSVDGPASCDADGGCVHGFTCQLVGGTACPAIACLQDAGCEPCTAQTTYDCEPSACQTDADCATGMVCYAQSSTTCTGEATPAKCPADEPDCGAATVEDAAACTTTTSKTCVPQYDVPCVVSSDCGPGFDCVPNTVTECSGGGAASASSAAGSSSGATSGGGAVANDPATEAAPSAGEDGGCTTTSTGTSSCQAQTIACTTSADCPTMWSCTSSNVVSGVVCNAVPVGEVEAGVAVDAGCFVTEAGPAQSYCTPPYAYLDGTGSLSNGAVPASASTADGGVESTGATAGGGASDTTSGAGSKPPSGSGGGCDVSGVPGADAASGGAGLLWVLGLLGAARRRRG